MKPMQCSVSHVPINSKRTAALKSRTSKSYSDSGFARFPLPILIKFFFELVFSSSQPYEEISPLEILKHNYSGA